MAVTFPVVAQGLTRDPSYLDITQDWTRGTWIRYPSDIGTFEYATGWNYETNAFLGTFQYP